MTIQTTVGPMDERDLAKTVGVEDRPDCLALWIEWRLKDELVRRDAFRLHKQLNDPVVTTQGLLPVAALQRRVSLTEAANEYVVGVDWVLLDQPDVLVRTDRNVVLKHAVVEAAAVGAAFG